MDHTQGETPVRLSRGMRDRGTGLVSVAAGVVAWELAARAAATPLLPPATSVLRAVFTLAAGGDLVRPLAASLASLAAGYGLAVLAGVLIGMVMGRWRTAEHLLDLYVDGLLGAPNIIFVPVFFALFGVSRLSQIAVVFVSSFAVIASCTFTGVRTADRTLVEMARAFSATERQLFRTILLPGARPYVVAGLRMGAGRAVKGMINGEMLIAVSGLGAMIRTYGSRFETDKVLALTLVVLGVALGVTRLLAVLERRLPGVRDQQGVR